MAAYDHEWVFEDDHDYQAACNQPETDYDEYDDGDDVYDGQPDEYTEWQDYMGGDDWDQGQYDCDPYE